MRTAATIMFLLGVLLLIFCIKGMCEIDINSIPKSLVTDAIHSGIAIAFIFFGVGVFKGIEYMDKNLK